MRLLAATALFACAVLVTPAGAAARPQIVDPEGDALSLDAGVDVVSALFSTGGTTAKVRGKRVYTPTKLLVTVTYAGDVTTDADVAQVVEFDLAGCGAVYLERFNNGDTYARAECGEQAFHPGVSVTGRTLTYTLPFVTIGKAHFRVGTALGALRTYTGVADPAIGVEPLVLVHDDAVLDDATSAEAYRIS
jgi:hypothetical protein